MKLLFTEVVKGFILNLPSDYKIGKPVYSVSWLKI